MNKRFNFLDFLKVTMFSGAAWTGLALFCYILLNYCYYLLLFPRENAVVFGIERLATFILLLIAGIVVNGAMGLCIGVILGLISYAIFPRPYEVEPIYRRSLAVVTSIFVLVVGSYVWGQIICVIIGGGTVYLEAISFIMMMNLLVFGRVSNHCSSGYLNRGKAKTEYSG